MSEFASKRVLVIGDLMLDRFVYGQVARISPEAPAAIINAGRQQESLGGAGNVACNIVGLGAACDLVAVVGSDDASHHVRQMLTDAHISPHLVVVPGRHTTVKMRFVAHMHNTHLLRADWEDRDPLNSAAEDALLDHSARLIPQADVVILSDYQKGVLSDRVLTAIVSMAMQLCKPTVVDPKGADYAKYRGVTVLTPNVAEVCHALGRAIPNEDHDLHVAARQLIELTESTAILLTRGDKGVLIAEQDGAVDVFPATASRVVDVSGAGDTLIGSFALSLVSGAGLRNAARLANASAGIAVAKRGTSVVTIDELRDVLLSRPAFEVDSKIVSDPAALDHVVKAWKAAGLAVGFTNGCFDLIHPGHIRLLRGARAACDRLIVGLNSDDSVRRLKGPTRPIQDEAARATVMAALAFADAVVLFDKDTPIDLIRAIEPDVLIKGADYRLDQVVGRDLVEGSGGRVVLIDLLAESSTTKIVTQIASERAKDEGARQSAPSASLIDEMRDRTSPIVVTRLRRTAIKWCECPPVPALFLDRDGVIIGDTGYVRKVEDAVLLPGVGDAIRHVNEAGIPVVVVSNQSAVGRGLCDWSAIDAVDDAIACGLAGCGAHIDLVLYCGAAPDDDAEALLYRKPAPGLLLLSARILSIDLARSVLVGDRPRDLVAAARAGLASALIVGGEAASPELQALSTKYPDFGISGHMSSGVAIMAAVAKLRASSGQEGHRARFRSEDHGFIGSDFADA